VAVHGEEPRPNEWIRPYRELVRNGLANADVVVAPSRWMLQAAERHYGNHRNGVVIYNGRNPGLFNPHMTKEDLAVTVGRVWDKAKQVSLLTQAEHHVPVWIAGEEQHPDPAFQGSQSLRSRGVRLCGKQP